MQDVTTYEEAVDRFLVAATWLTDADLPGVMSLRSLAKALAAAAHQPDLFEAAALELERDNPAA